MIFVSFGRASICSFVNFSTAPKRCQESHSLPMVLSNFARSSLSRSLSFTSERTAFPVSKTSAGTSLSGRSPCSELSSELPSLSNPNLLASRLRFLSFKVRGKVGQSHSAIHGHLLLCKVGHLRCPSSTAHGSVTIQPVRISTIDRRDSRRQLWLR